MFNVYVFLFGCKYVCSFPLLRSVSLALVVSIVVAVVIVVAMVVVVLVIAIVVLVLMSNPSSIPALTGELRHFCGIFTRRCLALWVHASSCFHWV